MMIFGKVWLIENYSRLGVLVCKHLQKNNRLKFSCKIIEKKALLNNLQLFFIITFF